MIKKEIGLVYLCIWDKAKQKSLGGDLPVKDLMIIINKWFSFPKKFVYPIIKEMENKGLIEWENKRVIKVLDVGIDLENTSKLYQDLNFF